MAIWPVKPVQNAKDTTLDKNPGTLPNMFETLQNFFSLLTFDRVTKSVVNFNLVEVTTPMQFQGLLTPFSARQLKMMPEGQRSWKWYKIVAWPTLSLENDDVLIDQSGVQYRIMRQNDYTMYGYLEYDAVQDFTGSGPETP